MTGEPTREFMLRAQRLLGVNCRQFAKIAGVKHHTVRQWRRGEYGPGGQAVLNVVNALMERNLGQS